MSVFRDLKLCLSINAKRTRDQGARFRHNQSGSLLIQSLVYFTLLMGMAGLTIDIGRIYIANTSAQAYVDQIALAAAWELNNRAGAIDRATDAAFGVDETTTGDNAILRKIGPFDIKVNDLIDIENLVFLTAIPDDIGFQYNMSNITSDLVTNDDAAAEYVMVISRPIGIITTLLRFAELGGGDIDDILFTRTVAVAGNDTTVCEAPLLMICNPFETTGTVDGDASFAAGAPPGTQILMKDKGSGASWTAGNFGTIDLPDDAYGECPTSSGNSAARQTCLLGIRNLTRECTPRVVHMDTGVSNSIHSGFNTRFDIWNEQADEWMGDVRFAPDVNVSKGQWLPGGVPEQEAKIAPGTKPFDYAKSDVKAPSYTDQLSGRQALSRLRQLAHHNPGHTGGGGDPGGGGGSNNFCRASSYEPATPSLRMPRAPCLIPDPDTCATPRVGPPIGNAALATYWANNHPAEHGVLPADVTTRYELYQREINLATALGDSTVDGLELDGNESGHPQCAISQGNPGVPDRRTFIMAVVNCSLHEVNGNEDNVPVHGYVRMFLTEPMVDNNFVPSSDQIFAEVVGEIEVNGDDGILHEYPYLVK